MKAILARGLVSLLTTIAFVATAAASEPPDSVATSAGDGGYRLRAGDVLEISVWKEEGLDKQVLVRPDGGLSFPLAGDLPAAGLTPVELRDLLSTRLGKYLEAPTVTVSVVQANGSRFYVVGKVNRPGAYQFDRPLDVMQALSLAGGTTEFAGADDIRILRRGPDGVEQVFEFEYSDVARGRRLEQNIELQSGDTLVVP